MTPQMLLTTVTKALIHWPISARIVGGLKLPNLGQLGLGNLTPILGVSPTLQTTGVYGRLTEVSAGKDTTTGHWELSGIILPKPFPTYPHGFPADWLAAYEKAIGRKTIGNYPASGTEIIKELGAEHLRTGQPIGLYVGRQRLSNCCSRRDPAHH